MIQSATCVPGKIQKGEIEITRRAVVHVSFLLRVNISWLLFATLADSDLFLPSVVSPTIY